MQNNSFKRQTFILRKLIQPPSKQNVKLNKESSILIYIIRFNLLVIRINRIKGF